MLLTPSESDLPPIQFERLVQAAIPGSRLLRVWPLTGGISAQMTALELAHPDGSTLRLVLRRPGAETLRLHPQSALAEFKLLQILQARGLAVPAPIGLDPNGRFCSSPALLLEYIEGQPDFAPSDAAAYSRQLAAQLAQIHSTGGANLDLSFLPPLKTGFFENFAEGHANAGVLRDEDRIRAVLQAAWPIPLRNPTALLHGDYWPGNFLWRNGQLAAIIDWEDAGLGDPLIDLSIARLDLYWIFNRDFCNTFTRDYFSCLPVDAASLPYWDLCAVLRLARLIGSDLAGWAAFFHPYGRLDLTAQSIRASVNAFAAQALEDVLNGLNHPTGWFKPFQI